MRLVPAHLVKMDEAVGKCDIDLIRSEICFLRGLSLDVGANKLSSLTQKIEALLEEDKLTEIGCLISHLKSEAENTFTEMSDYLFKSN